MAQRPSISEYIETIKTSAPKMINNIQELAKAEIKPAAKNGGLAVGLFAAAAIVVATVLWLVLITIGFALAIIFSQVFHRSPVTSLALGFLLLVVLSLILAGVLAVLGISRIKKVKAPQATIAEAKASLAAISEAVSAGVQDAQKGHLGQTKLGATNLPKPAELPTDRQ